RRLVAIRQGQRHRRTDRSRRRPGYPHGGRPVNTAAVPVHNPVADAARALALVARNVANTLPSERIYALRDEANFLGRFVAQGWTPPATAADRIIEVAELHGMAGEPGSPEASEIEEIARLASQPEPSPDEPPPHVEYPASATGEPDDTPPPPPPPVLLGE